DTAFPHRSSGHNFLLISEWMDPKISDRCIAWARETYAAIDPFFASGRYVNYLDNDEAGDPVAAAYGTNYRRLQRIQGQVTPEKFPPHDPTHPTAPLSGIGHRESLPSAVVKPATAPVSSSSPASTTYANVTAACFCVCTSHCLTPGCPIATFVQLGSDS